MGETLLFNIYIYVYAVWQLDLRDLTATQPSTEIWGRGRGPLGFYLSDARLQKIRTYVRHAGANVLRHLD